VTSRVTMPEIVRMKAIKRPIVSVTAYDYTFAQLLDRAGVDLILVGDSLGMVIQGHETTLPVTLDQMIYHTAAVVRGSDRAMVICDLPFGVCQSSKDVVMAAAIRILKETGCDGVKIEGGVAVAETISFLAAQRIPVVAHVGLTPQSVKFFGGFKVQGREEEAARQILADALAVEEAGAFAVVLEGIPSTLASQITEQLSIPTIGIGAGVGCDGQVLVLYDLLGLYEDLTPRFVKQYMSGGATIRTALEQYAQEVRDGRFPGPEHGFDH
jgi:3-methyl-2-oxobutanoate hydroxymethyltransferase